MLTQLLEVQTNASLLFDGNGVHPKPATKLRANGQGIATLATVIGFDLTCARAVFSGLAPMPGFLIHDSPKASDLEAELYDRVYDPILALDDGKNERASFQYIIATTSPPSPSASIEPYVRLTLDAYLSPEGRLLKKEL